MISVDELISMMELYDEDCPYFEGQSESIRAIRCPALPNILHAPLMERGYRHSGDVFYIPECKACKKCLPIRIPVNDFVPSKKQRHIFNKNRDVAIHVVHPKATTEKFELYKKYLQFQHPGQKADSTSYERFTSFLYQPLESSAEIQYLIGDRLAGITLADIIPGVGLSSIYHFFEPDFASRSIGVFSVLAEIYLCMRFNIPYYYLGFWIPGCKKMEYKSRYRPYEIFLNGQWTLNTDTEDFMQNTLDSPHEHT